VNTYIKLLIGLVLFGSLVALTVFQVPNDDRLLDLIYAALVGLGIYHLGDRDDAPTAPTDKQSGNALPGFLAMLGLTALTLTGCMTPTTQPTPQATQVSYTQACAAWGAGFSVALEMRRAGKLSPSQIDQITLLDNTVTPLCTGPLPADPTQAAQQVTAAVTTLAILEAVHQETK
jgi:hypothetical protein